MVTKLIVVKSIYLGLVSKGDVENLAHLLAVILRKLQRSPRESFRSRAD